VRRAATALAVVSLLGGGCAPRAHPPGPLVRAEPPAIEDDLDTASLRTAIERTRPAWERAGSTSTAAAAGQLLALLESTPDAGARRAAIARAFRILRVRDPLLLTAYYEPELTAHLAPDETFRFPLYARPLDLVDVDTSELDPACGCRRLTGRLDGGRLRPYFTRAEIDAGVLAGRDLEIAWAADPVDVFLLHVQGSGRLRLDDEHVVGVRYAASNGRPYRSIARALLERGLLPSGPTTVPDIRRVLEGLPESERAAVLATDERYLFFRFAEGGPVGSLGVELTPGRSIAADPRLVPPGSLAYLRTPSAHRFVVAQDMGAAIEGPHVDLFLGASTEAAARAGATHERGTLYLLVPR
jgi:membrane-bound lytic murein transglycosylase A